MQAQKPNRSNNPNPKPKQIEMQSKSKKDKYVEKEAQHSGSESSKGGSGSDSESEGSMDDFIVKDDEEEEQEEEEEEEEDEEDEEDNEEDEPSKTKSKSKSKSKINKIEDKNKNSKKRPRIEKEKDEKQQKDKVKEEKEKEKEKPKKQILIPSRPQNTNVKQEKKNYDFRITITNGQNFLRFMLPVANAVNEMRFNLAMTPSFTGLRLEAHDTCATLANISKFDCDIDAGVSQDGKALTKDDISAITFCVATKTFMQTMNCSVLKEAVLTITRYNDKSDALTFESSSNEDDVRAVYSCTLLDQASQEPLQFSINLNFHVTVELKTLKELSQNAKKCGAASIRFEVFQRLDEDDESIVHSKMSIGFKSGSTSGSHGFYHSARKSLRNGVVEWTSIPGTSHSQEGMEKKCNNSYDISKLRTFLSHMDCEWALIHLPDDNTEQPLVIECDLGGPNTKHTIIISPNLADAE